MPDNIVSLARVREQRNQARTPARATVDRIERLRAMLPDHLHLTGIADDTEQGTYHIGIRYTSMRGTTASVTLLVPRTFDTLDDIADEIRDVFTLMGDMS